jgi:DNA-binding transcriptional ArsR family regulator
MSYQWSMDPFAALADPVRRDLLVRLARGSARVVDLAADHAISRPAISRHLRVLAEAGLVLADDRGRERHYRLDRGGLEALTDWLATLEPRVRFPESALDGLDLEVRRTTREREQTAITTPDTSHDTSHDTSQETA